MRDFTIKAGRRYLGWLALALLGVGVLGHVAYLYREASIQTRTAELESSFRRAGRILQERLRQFHYGLEGLAGVYYVTGHQPSPAQLENYAASRHYFKNFRGALGFGFMRRVPRAAIPAYERAARADGRLNKVWSLGQESLAENGEAYVSEFVAPRTPDNSGAMGFNVATERSRYQAARHAALTGLPTLTAELSLIRGSHREPGFLIFHAVYERPRADGAAPALVGWTFVPILTRSISETLGELGDERLALKVSDWDAPGNDDLFSVRSAQTEGPGPRQVFTTKLRVYERNWTLEGRPVRPLWSWHDEAVSSALFLLAALGYLAILYGAFRLRRRYTSAHRHVSTLEAWQRAVLDGTELGIISTDEHGNVVTFNKGAESILGYLADEAIGKMRPEMFHDREEVLQHARLLSEKLGRKVEPGLDTFTSTSEEDEYHRNRWTFLRKDGERVPVQLSVVPLRDPGGNTYGFVGMFQDLTDLLRAESELRHVSEAMRHSAIVATIDLEGRILDVNDKFCETSGYAREALLGQNHRIVAADHYGREFFSKVWRTIRAGEVWAGEIQNRAQDGTPYWVHTVLSPIWNERQEIDRILSIQIDVTKRKQAEAQLVHSAQLASLGEMAGGMAHEINNPLAVIKGRVSVLSQRLERGTLDVEKTRADLVKVDETIDRIAVIVSGLRNFSRDSNGEPLQIVPTDLMIEETVRLCRERFRHRGVPINVTGATGTYLEGRRQQLSQALLNLFNNSLDAVQGLSERWIEIHVGQEGETIRLTVTDAGFGIAADVAAKMMHPFFTTKDVGKGRGLGLSIAKGLLEAQGGSLNFVAGAPRTRFVIELKSAIPAVKGDAA